MSPEDLLEPAKLPPDLQWVANHHRLNPEDPVYLLIAWHWHRVKASEDALQAGIVELKTALDARIEALADTAEVIAGVNDVLAEIRDEMANRPGILGKELETQLAQPVAAAVAEVKAREKSIASLARSSRRVHRRELAAALLSGAALGELLIVLLLQT